MYSALVMKEGFFAFDWRMNAAIMVYRILQRFVKYVGIDFINNNTNYEISIALFCLEN